MDSRTRAYYQTNTADRVALWESVESPLAALFPTLFTSGQRVLDVGSGSGRDMALLLRLGVDARGLEPVDQLRAAAVARHPELAGRIVALPAEAHAEANPAAYDGILLSAVLMHIPDSELFDFVIALRRLLRPGDRSRSWRRPIQRWIQRAQ